MSKQAFSVNEAKRTIVSTSGYKQTFHNVTEVGAGSNWLRVQCAEGYVLVNPAHRPGVISFQHE